MNRNYFVIIAAVALCSLLLIFFTMLKDAVAPKAQEQDLSYPHSPYKYSISGVGIVEPKSGNILIGSPVNRIVNKVVVTVGQNVKKGDILFQFDDRDLVADLFAQQVAYETAHARLTKLEALPRLQDVSAGEAALRSARLELNQAKNQYEMVQELKDSRALSQEEINRRQFNYEQSKSKWQQAQADLEKTKIGAWEPNIKIAQLEALQAQANVDRVKALIEQTIIRSPIDGTVLQVNIHEGELPSSESCKGLMTIGNTEELYLRVSINQYDASYFRADEPATAYVQGNTGIEFPLEFIRVEPYLVNKQNITNDIMEKVDTRVLHVIYRFHKKDQTVFIGEQMDVFIETKRTP